MSYTTERGTMTVERIVHSGAWRISSMIDGYLLTRTYYGFTRRDAIYEYQLELKEQENAQ